MPSEPIGTIGRWDIYIATALGEYKDPAAVQAIQEARYRLITEGTRKGNPIDILCTAITLDHERGIEKSPFDEPETTYHIFAIGNREGENKGELGCACAYAFERHGEDGIVGLPHENKVSVNGYPEGYDLDQFRHSYPTTGLTSLELFRYFKDPKYLGDRVANFGVFRGGIQKFIKERAMNGEPPAILWFFTSDPSYYQHLYRKVGSMSTPMLIDGFEQHEASPHLNEIERNEKGLFFNGIRVSYKYPIILSREPGGKETMRVFDYMPQVIDWRYLFHIVKTDPYLEGHDRLDKVGSLIMGEDIFRLYHEKDKEVMEPIISVKNLEKMQPFEGWEGEIPSDFSLENQLFEEAI
jgi:hypothetical protein